MKVAVFGASGVIGQHLRLCCPVDIMPVYVRRTADPLHLGVDLCDAVSRETFLAQYRPDVIVNLAGESNTDRVEMNSATFDLVNVMVPELLAAWCDKNSSHLIQISTQAVFDGFAPPYSAQSPRCPINEYGDQKATAELIISAYPNWTIVRPTFVLGVRPMPFVGRANPVEQMCAGGPQKQVDDRWFSPSFARDVAEEIWMIAQNRPKGAIIHLGVPERTNRYELACKLADGVERVSHESFPGLAPRPTDTTYGPDARWLSSIQDGLTACAADWDNRQALTMPARAREIALFLGKREDECLAWLNEGWDAVHQAVTDDWNRANPLTDWQILEFYRRTEAYIWELSHYHASPGWNYSGMVEGILRRLAASETKTVLFLGDGIGDATLAARRAGLEAVYHDLEGSRTAQFAAFRSWLYLGQYMPTMCTRGWTPQIGYRQWDAIVSLDFLEHVTNVEEWIYSIRTALKPGGLFCAQNAFACGSGPEGSMPMHLARNDRFEKDWDPTLFRAGFNQESSNWYRVPAEATA